MNSGNCFGTVSRLCQGEGSKEFQWATQHRTAVSIFPASYALSKPALNNSDAVKLCLQTTMFLFQLSVLI